jgi:hypothetical protein
LSGSPTFDVDPRSIEVRRRPVVEPCRRGRRLTSSGRAGCACLAVRMCLPAVTHARRPAESANIVLNVILGVVAAVIAFGRLVVSPF